MKGKLSIEPTEQHVIDKVKKYRISCKLRQHDIAQVIHASSSFVGNVENVNNPSKYNLKHIRLLSEYFELSPSYFLPEKPIGAH